MDGRGKSELVIKTEFLITLSATIWWGFVKLSNLSVSRRKMYEVLLQAEMLHILNGIFASDLSFSGFSKIWVRSWLYLPGPIKILDNSCVVFQMIYKTPK